MDSENFKNTVLPLEGMLTKHAKKFMLDEQEVEDAVQETFLKLWELRDKLNEHPNINGLSVQILKNLCINYIKVKSRYDPIDNFSLSIKSVDICSELDIKDEYKEVLRIIDSLPLMQRRVFYMKHVDGYEVDEIADIFQCSKESVRMHLSRGRRRVNEIFNNNR